jgi:hypothetical protein
MAGKLSRRRLLALSAAGAVAALPTAATGAQAAMAPLGDIIERHKAAAAALDAACTRLDEAGQQVAQKYPAETCRAWLSNKAALNRRWPKVRKALGIERLERDRQRLDMAEKELAIELIAYPCRMMDEVQAKARYIGESDILLESFVRDERFIEALLKSLTG